MLVCKEKVTLVRHIREVEYDRYECVVMAGVSWFGKRGLRSSTDGKDVPEVEYTVRIPAAVIPQELPKRGEFLVRGVLGEYLGPDSLDGREYFKITQVGDNRRGKFLSHVVVRNT